MKYARTAIGSVVLMTAAIACTQCAEDGYIPQDNLIWHATKDAGPDANGSDAAGEPDATVSNLEWIPVLGLQICDGQMLNLAVSNWPKREWTPCGSGCLTAPATAMAGQSSGGNFQTGGTTINGETYLRTQTYGKTEQFHELRRMSDGAALFVLRFQRAGCTVGAGMDGSPFLFDVAHDDGDPENNRMDHWVARYDLPTQKLLVNPEWRSVSVYTSQWMAWNSGWGFLEGGRVRLVWDPIQPSLTTVYEGGLQYFGHGHGDLVAWVDKSVYPELIRSYTPTDGAKVLIPGDYAIVGFAFGDQRMVWVGGSGPDSVLGVYENVRLYWSPLTNDPAKIVVHEGPSMNGRMTGPADVDSDGDIIAVTTGGDSITGAPPGTYILRVSTGEYWFIQAAPDTFVKLVAVSEKMVLVTESSANGSYADFQTYRQYDLTKLSEYAQPVK